ncbi:MAG TPA: hypothetical protein VFM71_00580 [Gemmatimonadaceae bacterium]|nr:hypothetical protein [Gemmatimonadaceae bacterium]
MSSPPPKSIPDLIIRFREYLRRRNSDTEVAAMLRMNSSYVSKIRRGDMTPTRMSADTEQRIRDLLDAGRGERGPVIQRLNEIIQLATEAREALAATSDVAGGVTRERGIGAKDRLSKGKAPPRGTDTLRTETPRPKRRGGAGGQP